MKIGFFDSGIGGISVLHLALKALPEEEFLYYADEEHVPYGLRTREEICSYVDEAVHFLIQEGADCIVVACNTATSAAISYVRGRYDLPILGMEPAVQHAGGKRVLVTATPFTIREEKLHQLVKMVDKEHVVTLKALPELVNFAEQGDFGSAQVRSYLLREFSDLDLHDYGELVLGCTHFCYFRRLLADILGPEIEIIDGGEGTVHHLVDIVKNLPSEGQNRVRYFRSGVLVEDTEVLSFYEKLHQILDLV